MKKLILVRHAKSDWSYNVEDFQRPLNSRGHKDAPKMAKFLKENGFQIDAFVTSPAKRALTTCRYFAETFEHSEIEKKEDLYESHLEDFTKTILYLNDDYSHVALFSHNPGISDFASSLTQNMIEFPTCGVAVFEVDCEEWSQFEGAEKRFLNFFIPKGI